MFVPSTITSPSTLAEGIRSFMRFRQRMKVDLPHPEGPMMAVIFRSFMLMLTFFSA